MSAVMIAVGPHNASNTAAVLDPVTKTLIKSARFANTADGYRQLGEVAHERLGRTFSSGEGSCAAGEWKRTASRSPVVLAG